MRFNLSKYKNGSALESGRSFMWQNEINKYSAMDQKEAELKGLDFFFSV